MQYVYTKKQALIEAKYTTAEVLNTTHDRDFYVSHPAPVSFTIDMTELDYDARRVSEDDMYLLSVWYNRGTRIGVKAQTIACKNPRAQWNYSFVDSLPAAYITRGCTTAQKAYDFGKELIARCSKASKIPNKNLEDGYKAIMHLCMRNGVYALSPNPKTWLEVKAEQEAAKEIYDLYSILPAPTELSDIELNFYARVFEIEMPQWFLRANHIKTNYGYAVCPYTDSTEYVMVSVAKKDANGNYGPGYAGNDFEVTVPVALLRDATPQLISYVEADRAKLAEQVNFYLELPLEEQLEFMSADYGYCTTCKEYFSLRDGCTCQENEAIPDEPASKVSKAYRMRVTEEIALARAFRE